MDGLNHSTSFVGAYDIAVGEIAQWEREDGEAPSLPQIDVGDGIAGRLQLWRSQLVPGPVVPYPYDAEAEDADTQDAEAGSRQPEPAAAVRPPGS